MPWHLVVLTLPNKMTSVFSESNSRRICHSTSTSTLLVLSASFNYDNYCSTPHPTFSGWRLCRCTRSSVRREPSRLLRQSPDWRSEEDDRQVTTCPQLGSTNRLEIAQVRPGTHSFPAKSATLARRNVVDRVRFRVCDQVFRCLHKMAPEIPVLLRTEDVHLHTQALRIGTHFLLTRNSSLSLSFFERHLKTFFFSFY